jgi:hypothetical protein
MQRVISCAVAVDIRYNQGRGVLAAIEDDSKSKAFAQFHANISYCMATESYDGRSIEKLRYATLLLKGQTYRAIVLNDVLQGISARTRKELSSEFQRLAKVPLDASRDPIRAFGACVAALDPQNARKAIGGLPASDAEDAAYAALTASMSQCIAPGENIAFTKQVLEGALAEGLFVLEFGATPDPQVKQPR